jgi:hypothetical protein
MTTRTRADLITEVLDQLGVLAAGQTPAAEDVAKIDNRLDNVLEEISALGIYTVQMPGTIGAADGEYPAEIIPSLGSCVANRCAGSFGLGGDPALDVMARRAEKTLYTIQRPLPARRFLNTDAALRGVRLYPGRGSFSNGT